MPISPSYPSSALSNAPSADALNDTASSAPIDGHRVRALFAEPSRVRESEFMRREISTRMHERLALVKISPERVLDAGCGDGPDIYTLQQRFAQARILGLDASFGMVSAAQDQKQVAQSSINRLLKKWLPIKSNSLEADLLCGDFAALPLAQDVVDLVWSNLALHWHPQPDRVFAEWRRVLKVDGLLMFSCFGPDTFKELRSAFSAADYDAAHILPFVDMHDFGDMLVNVGFSTPVMDMETITVTYDTVQKLLADVKSFGGNPLATRKRSLIGRAAWKRVVDAIEATRRADGKLPLTFEIIYGHAFRPAPRKAASGESIVRWDLDKKR
ncbi:methyltransferase domain-containing protein [Glaciimonas sp. PAMC28666]|uniref:methyltransferase domain-containing protein n=1 Tax=Glaciimonas sp. PAMC28666 TaxID=2807626 RepID=UPI00196431AD|nr:methyltransferase domain-containing protein [Glaciimonas sp. PAMC28666]QRX83931.1 methyltransferase domain-containing protein [Glaciimonas sp. PAMC28666]